MPAQGASRSACELRHFNGVGQTCAEVVAVVVGKYLGLVLEAAERARVHDAITIAFVAVAVSVFDFGHPSAASLRSANCPGLHVIGDAHAVSCSGEVTRSPPR